MRLETTQGLYRYWNTVRGTRLAPRRYEIEPAQIAPFLGETLIIERLDNGDCQIRVAGTSVCDTLGFNLKGRSFFELWSADDQLVLRDNISTITEYGGVGFYTLSGILNGAEPPAHFELLLLPLTHLESRIDRMLACLVLERSPGWLQTAPPAALQLRSNELIWPEGRPQGHARMRDGLREPALFQGQDAAGVGKRKSIRRARLVRDERRSFLVYDGGRDETPTSDKPRGWRID